MFCVLQNSNIGPHLNRTSIDWFLWKTPFRTWYFMVSLYKLTFKTDWWKLAHNEKYSSGPWLLWRWGEKFKVCSCHLIIKAEDIFLLYPSRNRLIDSWSSSSWRRKDRVAIWGRGCCSKSTHLEGQKTLDEKHFPYSSNYES